ncbi:thiamine phosphate synthase [Kordiimonas pumila]|uniref:Thiamine phosphate synthase n=1 Tax=Kordiimonas pumila TaxID=2161677 RepID=A0ABV7D9R4_9PROT|nr:thiamine phosphate synthase [Kordiimonas pumila]
MVKLYGQKRSISAALAIGRAAGVPHLVFLTDEGRAPDPVGVCQHLPAGSIIICRDYDHPDRVGFAEKLRAVTRTLSQFLLVAGDPGLARAVDADGLHLPQYMLENPPALTAFGLVSAACHDHASLVRAAQLGLDFALVSPVFETASHVGEPALGVHRFARLVKNASIPVVALGGIHAGNAAKLKPFQLMGVAAIGAFIPNV